MVIKNVSFDEKVFIDELQDELDENYLLAWEILSLHDPNISKLDALLSEINELYHELTSLMTTTCESYSIDL